MTERKHMGEWSLLWKILMAEMWHEEELLIMALKSKTGNCQLEAPDFQEKKKEKILVRITIQRRKVSFSAMSYLLFWDRPSLKV